jgi:hypothetical protein
MGKWNFIATAVEEMPSYANNPQKEEKPRRTDRSTKTPIKTPTKSHRLYFYSCNTSSIVNHSELGHNLLNEWIKWASQIYRVKFLR